MRELAAQWHLLDGVKKFFSEGVTHTKKDYVTFFKLTVIHTGMNGVYVHQPLIVARPFCKGSCVRSLNFNVE